MEWIYIIGAMLIATTCIIAAIGFKATFYGEKPPKLPKPTKKNGKI